MYEGIKETGLFRIEGKKKELEIQGTKIRKSNGGG